MSRDALEMFTLLTLDSLYLYTTHVVPSTRGIYKPGMDAVDHKGEAIYKSNMGAYSGSDGVRIWYSTIGIVPHDSIARNPNLAAMLHCVASRVAQSGEHEADTKTTARAISPKPLCHVGGCRIQKKVRPATPVGVIFVSAPPSPVQHSSSHYYQ